MFTLFVNNILLFYFPNVVLYICSVYIFKFPMEYFPGNLNSFIRRLLSEHIAAWKWEKIFVPLPPKQLLSQNPSAGMKRHHGPSF